MINANRRRQGTRMALQAREVTREDFAALLDESLGANDMAEGSVIKGTVVAIEKDLAVIDVGLKTEGRVALKEFTGPGREGGIKVGDVVEVYLERIENALGEAVISRDKARREESWVKLEKSFEANEKVEGIIFNQVKGGFTVDLDGAVAFLPRSQVDIRPIRDVTPLMNVPQPFQILKMDRRRGNIVVSRRTVLEESRAEQRHEIVQNLEEGQVVDGVVKNITDYGAFVDLGGIDGLLHVTDIAWRRVNHPTELLTIGQQVKVKIIKINHETHRISLGMKQLLDDPWQGIEAKYPLGARFTGRVTNITDYGAFVELEPGIEGLIHVSEMSWTKRIKHPSKVVAVGDSVEAVVLDVDERDRKISLGMKQIEPNPWSVIEERYPVGTRVSGTVRNITNFGVFVGLEEGIDGLVHVSDISWTEQIKHPSEKFNKGDKVEAVVLKIDKENEKFSLGIKQLQPNPWDAILRKYPVGSEVTGTVSSLADFGAFVRLEDGIEGLIYNSELAAERVDNASEVVKEGQQVTALVTRVDPLEQKISLSIKALTDREQRDALKKLAAQQASSQTTTLGDLLTAKLGRKQGGDD